MDAVRPRTKRTVYKGDLTGIQRIRDGDRIIAITATISRTIKGVEHSSPIRVGGEALARVGHMFEPGRVAFYGEVLSDGFAVIGPDLRRKTIAEAQVQARRPHRAYRSPSRIARDRYFAARARAARLQA